MLVNKWFTLSKYKQVFVIIILSLFVSPVQAQQQNLDANYVLNEMSSDQQVGFISGIISGLSFARWLKDDKEMEGMRCIQAWWEKPGMWNEIDTFFAKHPTRQPAPLVYILVRDECGE